MLRKRPFLNLYGLSRGKEGRDEYRLYPHSDSAVFGVLPFQDTPPTTGNQNFLKDPTSHENLLK